MVRFDAYSATTQAANQYQLAELFGPGLDQSHRDGFHGFGERLIFKDDSGSEVGAVSWGGSHQGRAMLEVKGERSPEVVHRLRASFPHRVTRTDACADWDGPGAFERLYRACNGVKKLHRIYGQKLGDWEDHPERGRTLMLGAKSSPTRMRLYEKGKQPEYLHLARADWIRAEVQVRPAKEAKVAYASLEPLQVWGASRWTRELAASILIDHVDPHPAGTTYRKSDLERRLTWLCTQGGPTILELAELCGSWECLGLTLREKMQELRNEGRWH